jgi:hypothetical protein
MQGLIAALLQIQNEGVVGVVDHQDDGRRCSIPASTEASSRTAAADPTGSFISLACRTERITNV